MSAVSALAMTRSRFILWLQVVPENLRSSIYAFDRCFEGAISALSAPLVGLVAERWFHYTSNFHGSTPQQQMTNATALGDGLLVGFQVTVTSSQTGCSPFCLYLCSPYTLSNLYIMCVAAHFLAALQPALSLDLLPPCVCKPCNLQVVPAMTHSLSLSA